MDGFNVASWYPVRSEKGWELGPLRIQVVVADKRYGIVFRVFSQRSFIEFRVTPGGRIKSVESGKPSNRTPDAFPLVGWMRSWDCERPR